MAQGHGSYPKWVYYRTKSGDLGSHIVQTPDGLKTLPAGWAESPDGVSRVASKSDDKRRQVIRPSRR
jgi:hypothetical protein